SYLSEMLADPRDSFARYISVTDADGLTLLEVGKVPPNLPTFSGGEGSRAMGSLQTRLQGGMMHARAPLLLRDNQVGTINFGISAEELMSARNNVLLQGAWISIGGFIVALTLLYLFTQGIGRRLRALTRQSQSLARGEFGESLREYGGDEIEVFVRALNAMRLALRERIVELESSQKRLHESEERFRILFDLAPIPLAVTDARDKPVAANIALWRAFGRREGPCDGMPDFDFWASPAERERIFSIYRKAGAVHGEIAQVRLADRRPGEVSIWSSTLNLSGEPAVVWAFLDQTEELNAKRELRELNASLEERVQQRSAALEQANHDLSDALDTLKRTKNDLISAEKMASLGSLVAGIAHELNTPIGNSLLAASSLADHVKEFDVVVAGGTMKRSAFNRFLVDISMASNLVVGSLHKAASLIASFKQVAVDQTSDQRRVFELEHVLQDTLATYAPRLRRANCAVSLEVRGKIELDSFPGSLCQVINNLINNALIHAFDNHDAPALTIAARTLADGTVALDFADNGSGMSEEVLRRVFDPFFTTKMGQGGTGLGMSIVYNIVTGMLGGKIEVESEAGRGTRVRLSIPPVAPRREMSGAAHKAGEGETKTAARENDLIH
ncbi:MAG TPA: ATP-binding protein, partial [Burkholderiaceae bacterium]